MRDVEQFEIKSNEFLSTLSMNELRAYGRQTGVARPTTKNKEILIGETIAILVGKLQPVPISRQGAPVKNKKVDINTLIKMDEFRREYLGEKPFIQPFNYQDELRKMRDRHHFLDVYSSEADGVGEIADDLPKGQVVCINGTYCLLPLDYEIEDRVELSEEQLRQYPFREGDVVSFFARRGLKEGITVEEIAKIDGIPVQKFPQRPHFDSCAVCHPNERLCVYEGGKHDEIVLKFIEWLVPIAKGQRGCILSSPKAGKTRCLLQIAKAAKSLNDDTEVFGLLVDQSLENIRDYFLVLGKEHLVYSTYEDDVEKQVVAANLLLQRIKRLAELGKDVLLLVDSFTALAHAYNDTEESTGGKTLDGGLEIKTVRYIKKYLAAARAFENGGSITILGTVNTKTGNPFDDVLAAELATQSNYEIRLSDELASRRVYPALDLLSATTALAEDLKSPQEVGVELILRKDGMEKIGKDGLIKLLEKSKSTKDFIRRVKEL